MIFKILSLLERV